MKRRTMLKQFGTAAALTSFVGTAAARPVQTLDVSDVSGEVPLSDLVDESDLDGYEGDLSQVFIEVDDDMDEFDPMSDHDCCSITCDQQWKQPDCPYTCGCCECTTYG